MDEISSIVQLFSDLLSNDNSTIHEADYKIQRLLKDDPNSFSEKMIIILNDYQNYPIEISYYCLLFLRKIFSVATNSLKTEDSRLSYSIIPQETANSYIPLIISFLSNENSQFSYFSSLLLGQLAIYMLNFDSNHPIFSMLVEQVEEGKLISPSLESIYFILCDNFKLFENNTTFQQEFMSKIQNWLSEENFPFESKPILIKMIILFVPFLSNILKTPEDNETFIQLMLALTQVPEFKFDSYEFWSNLAVEVPQLLPLSNSTLPEFSLKELDERLGKYPDFESEDEKISLQILQFWINFACLEELDKESTSKIVEEATPTLLPFLLQNSIKFIDISTLHLDDDEEYSIFSLIIKLIGQISWMYSNISIPILAKFSLEAIESDDIKEKVTGFYALNLAIMSFSEEEDEECFAFCTQCIGTSLSLIGSDFNFENQEMLTLVAQAIENVHNIDNIYPNSFEYSSLLPRLVEFMKSPICYNSKALILSIIQSEKLNPSSLVEMINALFEIQSHEAFDCIYEILNRNFVSKDSEIDGESITQILNQAISIVSQIVEKNSDIDELNVLLNPLLQIVQKGIDFNNEIILSDYQNFIQIILKCYENFQNSEAIKVLAVSAKIANDSEKMDYLINQIISQFDYFDGNNISMILSCLKILIFDMQSIDLSKKFGELIRSLLELQESSKIMIIKITILEAINFLHESYNLLMQPYITRLIPLFGSAATCFHKIQDEYQITLLSELLKASLLFVKNAYQPSDSDQEDEQLDQCLLVSYHSIQCFMTSDAYDFKTKLIFFDLLNEIIQKNPTFAQKILHESEILLFIQSQAQEFSDSPYTSLTSIIQFLS